MIEEELLEKLLRDLAYQFQRPELGLSFHRGWVPVIDRAARKIDSLLGEDKQGFVWVQIKEKFGSLRAYWELAGTNGTSPSVLNERGVEDHRIDPLQEELLARINEVVDAAGAATQAACIGCGRPGEIKPVQGWYLCLCDEHSPPKCKRKELELIVRPILSVPRS